MEDLIPEQLGSNWDLWCKHVHLVTICVRHKIDRENEIPEARRLSQGVINLLFLTYGRVALTPNSHGTLHLDNFMDWWAFSFSILYLIDCYLIYFYFLPSGSEFSERYGLFHKKVFSSKPRRQQGK